MSDLNDVKALLFDVFGTVVDWRGSVTRELEALGKKHEIDGNWGELAVTWRDGYLDTTRRIAQGGAGSLNVDVIHREVDKSYFEKVGTRLIAASNSIQILEDILATPQWKAFGDKLTTEARGELNLVWHRLHGWPDSTPGLYALKKEVIIATLSNANVRLLVDMAKFADLPWDTVFASEQFGSFKPDPKVYLGALKHLSLEPHNCAMVAAHVYDLRAAASVGMRTVYIPRADEEFPGAGEVKAKADGGDIDVVVQSFHELAALLAQRK